MSEGPHLVEYKNKTVDKIIRSFPYLAITCVIVMLAIYLYNFHGGLGTQSDFGAFGDFFGGILNPMLTFFTILLLLRQLMYQKSEIHSTAIELRATAEIHKENMKHNRAVDIYEKTQQTFDQSLSNFYESLRANFVKIPASEDDVISIVGLDISENKSIGAAHYAVSLETLLVQFALVRSILHSDKADKFTSLLITALNRAVHYGYEVYTLANTYEELEVNSLLYLKKFERFNNKLKLLYEHIDSLELENGTLQIDQVINALVHQSDSLIFRAQSPENLN